jgi:DNA/RNA-binding domain of Phe-tRNA-synthetase-like protein
MEDLDLSPADGIVEPQLLAEFPGLRLAWVTVGGRDGRSPSAIVERLRSLSNRYRGASVVAMRTQPIPRAYRAFFRQIGLDPDTDRIPSEEVALTRLYAGGFPSSGLLADARMIALVETGVAVWALDAERVAPDGLGIRLSVIGDRLGSAQLAPVLTPERLVVADSRHVHALLFGPVAPGHAPGRNTSRFVLFAVGVDGVPAIHLEEALWTCGEILGSS